MLLDTQHVEFGPKLAKIALNVCKLREKCVKECVKLRILHLLAQTVPMIPQTPRTDLTHPYDPEMAIWTHCALYPSSGRLISKLGNFCSFTFF